nr:hypothetical protein BN993_00740 [Virgibacillus halodenitrificans]
MKEYAPLHDNQNYLYTNWLLLPGESQTNQNSATCPGMQKTIRAIGLYNRLVLWSLLSDATSLAFDFSKIDFLYL